MARGAQAQAALAFPNAFGLTVRYAMKSSPNAAILKVRSAAQRGWRDRGETHACAARCRQLFDSLGLHIDASSGFEVQRAMAAGIAGNKARVFAEAALKEAAPDLRSVRRCRCRRRSCRTSSPTSSAPA